MLKNNIKFTRSKHNGIITYREQYWNTTCHWHGSLVMR